MYFKGYPDESRGSVKISKQLLLGVLSQLLTGEFNAVQHKWEGPRHLVQLALTMIGKDFVGIGGKVIFWLAENNLRNMIRNIEGSLLNFNFFFKGFASYKIKNISFGLIILADGYARINALARQLDVAGKGAALHSLLEEFW